MFFNRIYFQQGAAMLLSVSLASCASYSPVDVAKPSDLTLTEATREVGKSLVALREELDRGKMRAGLLIDEVDVNLKVTVNAAQGGTQKLTVDAANTALAGVGLKGEVTGEQTSNGSRENTITLKFKNIYTATLNKPGATYIARNGGGIIVYCAKPKAC